MNKHHSRSWFWVAWLLGVWFGVSIAAAVFFVALLLMHLGWIAP